MLHDQIRKVVECPAGVLQPLVPVALFCSQFVVALVKAADQGDSLTGIGGVRRGGKGDLAVGPPGCFLQAVEQEDG